VYFSPANAITIFYVNKRTKQIYEQKLDYYKDLRNYEFKGTKFLNPIEDVYTDDHNEKMFEVFDRYYPQILKTFFKVRKKSYQPRENDYQYIPPQYVQKGDVLGGGVRSTETIHDITTDPRNGRLVISTINSKGEIRNNSYYSDEYGIGMKYDKEKHNPM